MAAGVSEGGPGAVDVVADVVLWEEEEMTEPFLENQLENTGR